MESFTTLTSSAMVDHIILYYFPHKTLQNDWWKKLLRVSRLTSYKRADVRKNTETRVNCCMKDHLRLRVLTYGNMYELIEQIDWHIAIREEVVYKLA